MAFMELEWREREEETKAMNSNNAEEDERLGTGVSVVGVAAVLARRCWAQGRGAAWSLARRVEAVGARGRGASGWRGAGAASLARSASSAWWLERVGLGCSWRLAACARPGESRGERRKGGARREQKAAMVARKEQGDVKGK
jgi:hypothetical protein